MTHFNRKLNQTLEALTAILFLLSIALLGMGLLLIGAAALGGGVFMGIAGIIACFIGKGGYNLLISRVERLGLM